MPRANAAKLLSECSYPGLSFEVVEESGGQHLRVVCTDGRCNVTGALYTWTGRKWRLSPHMTDGEVVQTAFLALLTALEHEAREQFTFQGVSVFDPHFDIHKLVALRSQPGALVERE